MLSPAGKELEMAIYDFHTHTTLSDGGLLPIELIRRAHVKGYKAIGVTDHAGAGTMERVIREVRADCELASRAWGIHAFAGVELTHVPAADIAALAKKAKVLGAQIVVVHGETPVEPVEPGTDRAAVLSPDVDVLAHPGFITEEEAELANKNGIFIEISARRGHSLTNGHVAKMALLAGASMLVNSDAHAPGDLLDEVMIKKVALGAGLSEADYRKAAEENPLILCRKLAVR